MIPKRILKKNRWRISPPSNRTSKSYVTRRERRLPISSSLRAQLEFLTWCIARSSIHQKNQGQAERLCLIYLVRLKKIGTNQGWEPCSEALEPYWLLRPRHFFLPSHGKSSLNTSTKIPPRKKSIDGYTCSAA